MTDKRIPPLEDLDTFLRPHDEDNRLKAINRDFLYRTMEWTIRNTNDYPSVITLTILLERLEEHNVEMSEHFKHEFMTSENAMKFLFEVKEGKYNA